HESAFFTSGRLHGVIGVNSGARLLGQTLVFVPLLFVDRAKQGYGRTNSTVGAVARDDEAAHQRAGTAFQNDVGEGVDADTCLHHGRLRVHEVGDFAPAIKADP